MSLLIFASCNRYIQFIVKNLIWRHAITGCAMPPMGAMGSWTWGSRYTPSVETSCRVRHWLCSRIFIWPPPSPPPILCIFGWFWLNSHDDVWLLLLAILYSTFIAGMIGIAGSSPLFYELACETAFPIAEGLTNGVQTWMNNLVGLIFLLMFLIPAVGNSKGQLSLCLLDTLENVSTSSIVWLSSIHN